MKKSEMVEIIRKDLHEWVMEIIWEDKGDSVHTKSKKLLKKIEEAGMLPPPVEKELIRPLSEGMCSEFSIYYNTEDIDWEPEED